MSEHVSRPENTDSIESLLAELQATRADHCTQLNTLAEVIGIDLIHEHGTMIEAIAALQKDAEQRIRELEVQRVPEGFPSDVMTAAGLVAHGKQDKVLAERLRIGAQSMLAAAPAPKESE